MKEILLIKNGEIALKGQNRNAFEDALMKNLRRRLKPLGNVKITKAQSTMMITAYSWDPPMLIRPSPLPSLAMITHAFA